MVYDANVRYPNTLRDLLIRIGQAGLVQAKWTNQILDEMLRALNRVGRPDIQQGKLDRLRLLINVFLGGRVDLSRVSAHLSRVSAKSCPDTRQLRHAKT